MNEDFPHNLPLEEETQVELGPANSPLSGIEEVETAPATEANTGVKKTDYMNIATKAFAVVGVISVLGLLTVGGMKISSITPSSLISAVANITSIFVPSGADENISFTLDSHSLNSGEEMLLAWAHETKREGNYVFQYDCIDEVGAKVNGENVTCGTTFAVPQGDTELTLELVSLEKRFVDVPVSITFIPTEGATAQTETVITVTNTEANNTANTTSPSGSSVGVSAGTPQNEIQVIGGSAGGTGFSDPNGKPDLKVTILATGVVNKLNNAFTPGAVGKSDRAGVRFQIENIGTKASDAWSFIVDLPIAGDKLYVYRPTGTQRSLNPGERIEYTLGFDSVLRTNDTATAVVNVDPARVVGESNRENNAAEAVIVINN